MSACVGGALWYSMYHVGPSVFTTHGLKVVILFVTCVGCVEYVNPSLLNIGGDTRERSNLKTDRRLWQKVWQ